jgi:predicted phosphohydrolase
MEKKDNKTGLSICFFSDPHTKHYEMTLPEGDMAICCGDISSSGTRAQVRDFMEWFAEQPHKYKIMIAGNHDFWFEPGHVRNRYLRPDENPRDIIPEGITYLENETIEIEGIKIFGSPYTPWFHDWAFNSYRGEACKKHWDLIEPGTDIVITHGPPSDTHLDRCKYGDRVGCVDLAKAIAVIKPKICAFGHIHEAYGQDDKEILDPENKEAPGKITKLINCSVLNLKYEMTNAPVVIDWEEMCELHENKKESNGEEG